MRAVVVESLSGPSGAVVRDDVGEPDGAHPRSPGGRRVLVEVEAAGLSFIDPLQTRGRYQGGVDVPYVCGSELVGRVLEAPPDSWVGVGDRVAGIVWQGALADRALAIEDYLVRVPESMPAAQGASLYMNYATAWYALDRAAVVPGETVLVTGAAGGVGTCVLDLGPAFGVSTVALVSSGEKAEVARRAGADHVVRADGPWLDEVRRLTGGGVSAAVDVVGGEGFVDVLRALRVGGRAVVVGFTSGTIPEVRTNRLLLRNLTLTGIAMDVMETEHPGTLRRVREGVQALLDGGRLHPVVGAMFPFDAVREALVSIEDRTAVGKVVVVSVGAPTR